MSDICGWTNVGQTKVMLSKNGQISHYKNIISGKHHIRHM
jgi:hypothetical protein